MKKKARSYSIDFKQEAVRRMAGATTIVGLAKELGVRRKLLYQWRDQFRGNWGRPDQVTLTAAQNGTGSCAFRKASARGLLTPQSKSNNGPLGVIGSVRWGT